jgi:uracil-DNA glycosylase
MQGWKEFFDQPSIQLILKKIHKQLEEESKEFEIYPPTDQRLRIFEDLPWDETKVIIISQDPYINRGQAEGYCFSVPEGQPIPPSLRNIFKVLGLEKRKHGCLANWVEQGVMLLNMSLTVIQGSSNSHRRLWQPFTDELLQFMAERSRNKVYMLWGKEACRLRHLFEEHNKVLTSCHPSPLARNKFLHEAKDHFKEANAYLSKPIRWE